jgi:hypothetical protein
VARLFDRLNPSNWAGLPFQRVWDKVCTQIESIFETQQDQIDDLVDLVAAIAAADAAAASANAAAAAADAAATAAQETADDISDANEITTSYVSGATVSATDAGADATINISAHTRHYPQPDGSTVNVAVNGGSLTARAYSTLYYVYYDQASRAGGAVTYASSTAEVAQLGDRHVVGSVTTPAAAAPDTDGGTVRPPGSGAIIN